jgi:aldehyde dehydrogenase (NAD+)
MMVLANELASLRHADRFFVGGEWVRPASTATIEVIDSGTEQVFFRVAEAQEPTWPAPSRPPVTRSMTDPGRA